MEIVSEEGSQTPKIFVSLKRHRNVYERIVEEMFGNGVEVLDIVALRTAVSLAIELSMYLEGKQTVVIDKVITDLESGVHDENNENIENPSIRVSVRRHPKFIPSKFPPSALMWSQFSSIFDTEGRDYSVVGTIEGSNNFLLSGSLKLDEYNQIIKEVSHDAQEYMSMHKMVYENALKGYSEETTSIERCHSEDGNACIRTSFCQLIDKSGKAGIILDIFDDKHTPYNHLNIGIMYIISPNGRDYDTRQKFLEAVQKTAMAIVFISCAYNRHIRINNSRQRPKQIQSIRLCPFSIDSSMHTEASKLDVASAIINGLNEAYQSEVTPRVTFLNDNDIFKRAWCNLRGLEYNTNHDEAVVRETKSSLRSPNSNPAK